MITKIEKLISSNFLYINKLKLANFALFTINKDSGRLIYTMDLVYKCYMRSKIMMIFKLIELIA
uniref:Uncharacterized protein n=1 Tax=Lepeophtheirus salmonis TaxID=72036 RepID=A0A0K2UD21_LEPSM